MNMKAALKEEMNKSFFKKKSMKAQRRKGLKSVQGMKENKEIVNRS